MFLPKSVTRSFLNTLTVAALFTPLTAATDRECFACGKFYPAKAEDVTAAVKQFLADFPDKKIDGRISAILVPHAGYIYAGKVAGAAYRQLKDDYDTVVIIGPSHTTPLKTAALSTETFKTPAGSAATDTETITELLKNPLFSLDTQAHAQEHSIENQIPFLLGALKKPFKIIPIVISSDDPARNEATGKALAEALKGKKPLIVISADLSHYPPDAVAKVSDPALLASISMMDPDYFNLTAGLLETKKAKNLEVSTCGRGAITAGLAAARALGADDSLVTMYRNSSSSPYGEKDKVVGYGSMVFYRGKDERKRLALKLSDDQKHKLLAAARATLRNKFKGVKPEPALADWPSGNLPAAVFVTLTEKGNLRGCVGTLVERDTLISSVEYFALQAAFADSRFKPLEKEELPSVKIEISVLSRPEITPRENIIPDKHGVIIERDGQTGVFLPQVWKQLKTKEEFLGELCAQKAGMRPDCWQSPLTVFKTFTVTSFEEAEGAGAAAEKKALAEEEAAARKKQQAAAKKPRR